MTRRADATTGEVFEDATTEIAEESLAEADNGYSDDAMTLWNAGDVEELASFMDVELDLSSIPTADEASKAARMAIQKRSNDLIGHTLALVAWRPQDALLVSEGTITSGFFVVGRDLTTGGNFSWFVGGVALVRQLKRWAAPVRVKLEKRGRTLTFVNP
jgi:hypothetical protein